MTRKAWLGTIVAAVLMVFGVSWLNAGWNLEASSMSPDGRYRVDLYRGSRWQTAVYRIWYEDPGFARMSRTQDGEAFATSGVVDLADSRITWLPTGALVATQAEYHYATERWD